MQTGAITGYIDVAQLVLYAFWIFFAGLILYLRREDKREGYPLESDRAGGRVRVQGFPAMPGAKVYRLAHGGTVQAPSPSTDTREIRAEPVAGWPGAPLEPTGDPMLAGVGPGAYAMRADQPDLTLEGDPKIVPLRVAGGFALESRDPDPRGMTVVCADGEPGGTVVDVWVDRSEYIARYLEVATPPGESQRRVLLPMNFSRIDRNRGEVRVRAVTAAQLAACPGIAAEDRVTMLEEERVVAWYGAGTLYAMPDRLGPWI